VKDYLIKVEIARFNCSGDLYYLNGAPAAAQPTSMVASIDLWHHRLGHPSSFIVQQVLRRNKIDYTPDSTPYVCDSCQLAKSHQLPYPISTSRSTVPLEQVFSDVWGPAPLSVGKHAYYVSFIDDYSKFTWIYLLKKRSDVYQAFLNYQ
jgi:histone deacetylase 1/2